MILVTHSTLVVLKLYVVVEAQSFAQVPARCCRASPRLDRLTWSYPLKVLAHTDAEVPPAFESIDPPVGALCTVE